MRTLLILLRKDLANFLRDKAAVGLTFFVPVGLIYIFGFVFGLNQKSTGPAGFRLAVVNASDNPGAKRLVDALKAEPSFRITGERKNSDKSQPAQPLTEEDARVMIRDNQLRFALVLPNDLIRPDGIGLRLKILSNPQNEIETQTVNGLLQKTIFSSVPELLGESLQLQARQQLGDARLTRFNTAIADAVAGAFGGDSAEIRRQIEAGDFGLSALREAGNAQNGAGTGDMLASIVKIETEQVVGKDVKSPAATRIVGGWAIMFLLFAVSHSAMAFFDEKKTGIFTRLLSAPVSRAHLLWSRFLWGVGLGLVQLTALFFAGRLMYGIDVVTHFGNLVILCTVVAATCTAFGMLVTALTPTAAAANGLATFLVLTMSACGGAWFPVSLMPPAMQELAKFTFVYWAMEGFGQVLWAGRSLAGILPTLGILLGMTAGVMAVALWRFKRGNLFD